MPTASRSRSPSRPSSGSAGASSSPRRRTSKRDDRANASTSALARSLSYDADNAVHLPHRADRQPRDRGARRLVAHPERLRCESLHPSPSQAREGFTHDYDGGGRTLTSEHVHVALARRLLPRNVVVSPKSRVASQSSPSGSRAPCVLFKAIAPRSQARSRPADGRCATLLTLVEVGVHL